MSDLISRYETVRQFSETLAAPLSAEDCAIQSMPDASPTRWHLAHTTWFFETFLLKGTAGYRTFHPHFEVLFNSYYNSVGEQFPRAQRGMISRPGLAETMDYRRHVDESMKSFLADRELDERTLSVIEIGLQHEQQHQELILTDIKHALSINPLFPVYQVKTATAEKASSRDEVVSSKGGIVDIGFSGGQFCFDNELPRHQVLLQSYGLSASCVTNADYLKFMAAGGYQRPEFWLSAGWSTCQQRRWNSPAYWHRNGSDWQQFTLCGLQDVELDAPVCHVSYFEADAYARWAGKRLPTEFEWENLVSFDQDKAATSEEGQCIKGHWSTNLIESGVGCHPQVSKADAKDRPFVNAFGNVWEWTASQYTAYPGYSPPDGALGEYNGKFMCNQFVLRGGSCATPFGHIRPTYRNFFPPDARWQFSGIRLAH